MTSQSTNIIDFLKNLTLNSSYYYLESNSLLPYKKGDYTIYSRFKKIEQKPSGEILKKHINKDKTIAIFLDAKNYLVYEYFGKEPFAFGALLYKLSKENKAVNFKILDYGDEKLTIFIEFNLQKVDNLETIKKNFEKILEFHLNKSWRVIPNDLKPEIGNLIVLPREIINNPWV
jgi:hypothetical protein